MEVLNSRLARHEDMKRNEKLELTPGAVIKGVAKSIKRTFSPHNHEEAYGFRDDVGERTMNRTVKLDFGKNPFQSLEETFKFFDEDNSGHISRDEFAEAMNRLDHNHNAEELKRLMDEMDLDGDGMISFAEFSHAMSHVNFKGEGVKSHDTRSNSSLRTRNDMDTRAFEIVDRSKTLTLAAIETAVDTKAEGYEKNWAEVDAKIDQNDYWNTTAGEGEKSEGVEGDDMGSRNTRPIIHRNTLKSSNGGYTTKNFINKAAEPRVPYIIRQENPSEKRNMVARTFSLDADDLDYLERQTEAVGLYRTPDLEYGFVSRNVSGPVKRHGTSFVLGSPKPVKKPDRKISGISQVDEDREFDATSTGLAAGFDSQTFSQMGETEFESYNDRQKLVSRRTGSIYEKQYSWSPGGQASIRQRLAEKRKNRQADMEISAQNCKTPIDHLDNPNSVSLLFVRGGDSASNELSPPDSDESEYPNMDKNIENGGDSKVPVFVVDWAYLSDNEDNETQTEKQNKTMGAEREKRRQKRSSKEEKVKNKGKKSKKNKPGQQQYNEVNSTPGGPGECEKDDKTKVKKKKKKKSKKELKREADEAKDAREREVLMGMMPSHKEELLMMLSDSSSEDEHTPGGPGAFSTPGAYSDIEGEVHVWTTYYGLNSMSRAIVSTCGLDADKSPFMREESDFWISNRVANLAGGGLDRDLRRVKNWELKILVETQETLLAKTFKMPKKMLKFAWFFFVLWVVGMIGIIFLWGVNMDSDAEDKPDDDIAAAATSHCPARETVATGDQLTVDVSADDALNLKGAQNSADAVNANYTRYGNVLPFTMPDFDFMPEDAPESYRFLVSSVTSWASGTVVIPLHHNIITAFLLALVYRNEAERLRHLMAQKSYFRHTDIMDYGLPDQVFFICCWPEALIKILAEDTKAEDLLKLRLDTRTVTDKILEAIAKKV